MKKKSKMEDTDLKTSPKMKHKTERRRSSIFSLLNIQKKLKRQASEPGFFASHKLNRKYSVDSAILVDYGKTNGAKEFVTEICSDRLSICNGGKIIEIRRVLHQLDTRDWTQVWWNISTLRYLHTINSSWTRFLP